MLLAVEEGAAEIVEVPAWVPDSLAWLYLDIAWARGEEAAAAHARRLRRAADEADAALNLIDGDCLSEDTPEARNQRLGHLARLADALTAQELRRVDRLALASQEKSVQRQWRRRICHDLRA